jgi:plasmid replication initiation protein
MQPKKTLDPQLDLFVPFMSDVSLRDTQETMERPFFSLSKGKRSKPIEYKSPDGTIFVTVVGTEKFGMATIWDADILIWAASVMNAQRRKYGENDLGRTLNFQPYDLLRTIGRRTGGREYLLLRDALARLQATTIVTNIRPKGKKRDRQFSWIEGWSDLVNENGESAGMTLTVSEWFYEGIVQDKNLLSIDPAYFTIKGGRERWLYRVARKHAGGHGSEGYAIPLPTLFEKSGAEGKYKRFKFEMLDIAKRSHGPDSAIPGFDIQVEQGRAKEPSLRMIRQSQAETVSAPPAQAKPAKTVRRTAQRSLPLLPPAPNNGFLTEQTIANVRKDFPGWDVYAIKADFDEWLDTRPDIPDDYNAAFYGFARKWSARQGR